MEMDTDVLLRGRTRSSTRELVHVDLLLSQRSQMTLVKVVLMSQTEAKGQVSRQCPGLIFAAALCSCLHCSPHDKRAWQER